MTTFGATWENWKKEKTLSSWSTINLLEYQNIPMKNHGLRLLSPSIVHAQWHGSCKTKSSNKCGGSNEHRKQICAEYNIIYRFHNLHPIHILILLYELDVNMNLWHSLYMKTVGVVRLDVLNSRRKTDGAIQTLKEKDGAYKHWRIFKSKNLYLVMWPITTMHILNDKNMPIVHGFGCRWGSIELARWWQRLVAEWNHILQ